MKDSIAALAAKSQRLRQYILALAHHAGGAHIGPAYSIIDVLTVLYYGSSFNFSAQNIDSPGRDRFVLSKGHGCAALYAILYDKGLLTKEDMKSFCRAGGILGGHPDMHKIPGVEASTGSLGHGFSMACGIALAGKLRGAQYKTYTLLGDGECQEGSVWEAAMLAGNYKLDRLGAIVDYNKLQGMGRVEEINHLEPLADKFRSFGWAVRELDGHSHAKVRDAFNAMPFEEGKPSMIVAHTVKGKGVSFMENVAIWHYKRPSEEDLVKACAELGVEGHITGVFA